MRCAAHVRSKFSDVWEERTTSIYRKVASFFILQQIYTRDHDAMSQKTDPPQRNSLRSEFFLNVVGPATHETKNFVFAVDDSVGYPTHIVKELNFVLCI